MSFVDFWTLHLLLYVKCHYSRTTNHAQNRYSSFMTKSAQWLGQALDDLDGDRNPVRPRVFSFLHRNYTGPGAHPASSRMGIGWS